MKKIIVYFFIFMMIFSSCAKNYKTVTSDNDAVTAVPGDDTAMNSIIENARNTVNDFVLHFKNPEKGEHSFTVKYPFATDPGSESTVEHIWLNEIKIKDGRYFGKIANDPFDIKKYKYGDEVQFDIHKITDWMYIKNHKIIGGRSIQFLIESIPENERTDDQKSMLEMFQ